MKNTIRRRPGYNLVELLIIVAVMSILAVIAIPKAAGQSPIYASQSVSIPTVAAGAESNSIGSVLGPLKQQTVAVSLKCVSSTNESIFFSASVDGSNYESPAKGGRDAVTFPAHQGAEQPTNQKDTTVKRTEKIALLNSWGVNVKDEAGVTDARIDELIALGKTAALAAFNGAVAAAPTAAAASAPSAVSREEFQQMQARLDAANSRRIEDKINGYVDANRCTKAQAKIFLSQALASAESEKEVFAALEEMQPMPIGGDAAGAHIIIVDDGPATNKNGVQGSKIIPELDNIFTTHNEPAARYDAMKREFPRLLGKAFRKDAGVQAANTFSATITTNFLILGVITKLYNRFAAAKLFTRDAEQDPYKPLAAGIRKFNTTTTDGTQVQTDPTDFEGLGAGGDSTIDPITITPHQYVSGGHITNAQLNSGFRVADIIEAKLVDLAAKATQVMTAPITVANFVTNAALVSAPAAFGFSELADLQGTLKKSMIKNLLLDGEYIARIANTSGFFQRAGTLSDAQGANTGAWSAFGWDNIALNSDWTGAGANVRGFACNPQAIGIISGLPLTPPEGIPGNIVQTGVAMLPDVEIAIATYAWFSPSARTFFFTYDLILGATLIDETAGRLVKSA